MRPATVFTMTRVLALLLALAACLAAAATAHAKPADIKVMTRNLDLGANLKVATAASSFQELVNIAGGILNSADRNAFHIRVKGIAAEIRQQRPHLVGLQEVALWRDQPCDRAPLPPSATHVRYDYLQLLLAELNRGRRLYRVVAEAPQFDFEIWANTDGNESTAGPNCPMGSEINGRYTQRDVILARVGGVRTSRPRAGTFRNLLRVKPGGVSIDIRRGWTRVDALVGGKRFGFVNAHLEAFDNDPRNSTNKDVIVGNAQIREMQARELVRRGGAATGRLPVILLGDMNSDVRTPLKPGDGDAHRVLLRAGFVGRARLRPFACCLKGESLKVGEGASPADWDHTVDHVMTDTPRRVRLVASVVTGRKPVNGFFSADHAGIVSTLRFR